MGDGYQLWVDDERTTLVRKWDDGTVEVANRDSSAHTWGPPRYLTEEQVVDGHRDPECPFCNLVDGVNGAEYHRDTGCFVVPTLNPQAPTHLLVTPREHVATLNDASLRTIEACMATVKKVAADRNLDGYRVIINVGVNGKQKVFHLHVHLLAGPEVVKDGFARGVE